MPTYQFHCDQCGRDTDRQVSMGRVKVSVDAVGRVTRNAAAEALDAAIAAQCCEACEAPLRKVFAVPALVTDSLLMASSDSDDGFGSDQEGRMTARRKAAAAGINIAGKRFHHGLCRRGEMFDPYAWYGSRSEILQKANRLHRNVEGIVNVQQPVRDELLKAREEPYRVSRKTVAEDVAADNQNLHGGQATPAQLERLYEDRIERHSGSGRPAKPVKIGP